MLKLIKLIFLKEKIERKKELSVFNLRELY